MTETERHHQRGRSAFDRLRTAEIARAIRHHHHIAILAESIDHVADRAFSLDCWMRRVGAVIPPVVLDRVVADNPPRRRKAATLGKLLNLTDARRSALGVRTIRAVDVGAAEMTARRKAKARERERERRKAAGATPREQSLSRTRPWQALGISRSTWERRRKAAVTQIRAQYSYISTAHEIASPGGAARPAKRLSEDVLSSKAVRHTRRRRWLRKRALVWPGGSGARDRLGAARLESL